MKLNDNYEISEFIKTVNLCEGEIYLKINENEFIPLKKNSNTYRGIGHLANGKEDVILPYFNK